MAEETTFRDVMKAAYDYAATADDELSIKEDQLLYLLAQSDEDWAKVQTHTPLEVLGDNAVADVGLVPAAYIEPATVLYRATAVYDYEPNGEGEIALRENEKMNVYLKEDEWILVKVDRKGNKNEPFIGYVPANYVEEGEGEEEAAPAEVVAPPEAPAPTLSKSPPSSTPYLDPAERSAAAVHVSKSDPVQTWSVSEIDKKGKKKKGTLGVGNGAIFFASESDKAPVQQWQSRNVTSVHTDEDKHKVIDLAIDGPTGAVSLQFNAGSKDAAEAIVEKIESSKRISGGESGPPSVQANGGAPQTSSGIKAPVPSTSNNRLVPPPAHPGTSPSPRSKGVHWDTAPPAEIAPAPQHLQSDEEDEADQQGSASGNVAVALYDFDADGEDELSMKEGEQLTVIDKEGSDEWWKCRNSKGKEGLTGSTEDEDDSAKAAAEEARQEQERAAAAAAKAKKLAEESRRKREQETREAEEKRQREEAEAQEADRKQKLEEDRRAMREREAEERRASTSSRPPPAPSSTSGSGTKKSVLFHSFFKFAGTPNAAAGSMGLGSRNRSRSPARSATIPSDTASADTKLSSSKSPSFTSFAFGTSRFSASRARSASPVGSPKLPKAKKVVSSGPSSPVISPRSASPISFQSTSPRSPNSYRSPSSAPSVDASSIRSKSSSPPSHTYPMPTKSHSLPADHAPVSFRPPVPRAALPQPPQPPPLAPRPFVYKPSAAQAPFSYTSPAAQAPFSYLSPAAAPPPLFTHTRGQSKELPGRPNTDRPKPTNTRIWHDRSGQFRVEAEYLGLHNGKVRLHKSNGVIIEVPEEKMSAEDMEYIRRAASRNTTLSSSSSSSSRPAAAKSPPSKDNDDDNIPLGEIQRRPTSVSAPKPKAPPRQPRIDWFEFFLSAGCEIDDCTRYSSSFERDRMDESVLPDIKPDTLRALGLREGDVLRVMKKIEQGGWKSQASKSNDPKVQEQVRKDAELAARLQEQEYTGQPPPNRSSTTSPGLFTGPGGALRNNTRRGRPPPTKSATLGVDSISIANASEQLSRTSTPSISAASTTTTTTATTNTGAATGARTSTASSAAPAGGFDDDAWTPRPASAAGKPSTPAPPARAGSVPAVAPAPPPPPPPPAQPVTAPLTAAPAPAPPPVVASPPISSPPTIQLPATQQPTGGAIARPATSNPPGSTLPNEFDVLAKIGSMRAPSAPVPPTTTVSPPIAPPPPVSYQNGLGMGGGASMGTFLTAQQTGALSPLQPASGPRAPFAPVPANERLLQPLIPTNTGFNSFVPTRPPIAPPIGSSPLQSTTPSFLTQQPTGFNTGMSPGFSQQPPSLPPLQPTMTGIPQSFQQPLSQPSTALSTSSFSTLSTLNTPASYQSASPSPLVTQPTGFGPGGYGSQFGASNPGANFLNAVQAQPTGMFNSTPSFNPPSSTTENHSPANVFAAMKAGSFANAAAPQNADKYDALRPQPTGWSSLQPQPTGFQGMLQPGMQPQPTGFQPGFGTGFGQQPPPGFQGGYGFGR